MNQGSRPSVPVGWRFALLCATGLYALVASVGAGAEPTPHGGSERAAGDLWRVARQLPDPETFIWRLRQDKPLTADEQAYLDRFRRGQGLDRREVADHLERLLRETRFRDYTASQTSPARPGAARGGRRTDSDSLDTQAFAILIAVAVLIVFFDLLLLRARSWRRPQGPASLSADQLLGQARVRSGASAGSVDAAAGRRSAGPSHTD